MPTPGETTTRRRRALVVATGRYADPTLTKLRAPGRDAADLAAVLEDAAVGGFEVETALDAPAESLRRQIARFCARGGPDDLALVYLSCHGVLDDRGRLYYAATDTDRALLSATAVSSAWLNEQLEDCRCRRQILVLDCCHSGAFAKGGKGGGDLALQERFEGRGRVVLTGSRATEYSFEQDRIVGDGISSVFTGALVEGLRTGDADRDGDGVISVSELYDYAYEAVRGSDVRQTPTLWTYGAEGDLMVAFSARGAIVAAAPLPEDLVTLLESPRARVREGAVAELADVLTGPHAGRALTARTELERIAAEDVPGVAAAARAALHAGPSPAPPDPPLPIPPGRPPPSAQADPAAPTGPASSRLRTLAIAAAALAVALAGAAIVHLGGGSGGHQSAFAKVPLSGSPRGVAASDGATWVTRYDDGQVSRIDSSLHVTSIDVGPHPGKIAAAEGVVWVSYDDGKRLARIDTDQRKVARTVTVDTPGCDCAVTQLAIAKGKLWVGSDRRRTITTLHLQSGDRLHVYHPGAGFRGAFAVDGTAVWAVGTADFQPPEARVMRIDLASGRATHFPIRANSYFVGVAYGEGTVWIADAAKRENVVTAFDPSTNQTITDVPVSTGIVDDDIAVGRGAVFVWSGADAWLSRIDTHELQLVNNTPIHGYRTRQRINEYASDLALDGDSAWVTDPVGNAVYKVDKIYS